MIDEPHLYFIHINTHFSLLLLFGFASYFSSAPSSASSHYIFSFISSKIYISSPSTWQSEKRRQTGICISFESSTQIDHNTAPFRIEWSSSEYFYLLISKYYTFLWFCAGWLVKTIYVRSCVWMHCCFVISYNKKRIKIENNLIWCYIFTGIWTFGSRLFFSLAKKKYDKQQFSELLLINVAMHNQWVCAIHKMW